MMTSTKAGPKSKIEHTNTAAGTVIIILPQIVPVTKSSHPVRKTMKPKAKYRIAVAAGQGRVV